MSKRDSYLRRTYGISQKIYKLMLKDQAGVCYICSRPPKPGKNLAVDHDHRTGRVRGALCWKCNYRLLGRNREDPKLHERAALYLRRTIDWRDPQTYASTT